MKGIDPHETISNWNNIHDFLYGIKGGRSFEYWTVGVEDGAVVSIDRHNERAIRYYCSKEGKSILKNWVGGKKLGDLPSAVPNTKGQSIKVLQNIRDRKGEIFREKKTLISPSIFSEPDEKGRRKRLQKAIYERSIESKYPDLDYIYYVREAWKWIKIIENNEQDVENAASGLAIHLIYVLLSRYTFNAVRVRRSVF